jgi:hypothetical protein
MANYNPWGKAGAGAPIRNSDGTVTSSRAKVHQQQLQKDQHQYQPPQQVRKPFIYF